MNRQTPGHEIEAENLNSRKDLEGELAEGHDHAIASIKDTTTSTIIIIMHDFAINTSIHLVVTPNPSVDSYRVLH